MQFWEVMFVCLFVCCNNHTELCRQNAGILTVNVVYIWQPVDLSVHVYITVPFTVVAFGLYLGAASF